MGDVIHAMPAVAALRKAHPDVVLGWAIEPRWAPLLSASPRVKERGAQQPLVERVHYVPFQRWKRKLAVSTLLEITAMSRELRSMRYDACLDLQGSVRSAWLQRRTNAPRLIGEQVPREKPARLLFNDRVRTHGVHVIEQDLELCAAVFGDAKLDYVPPPYPVVPEAEAWADQQTVGADCALLLPGAGWGAKRWPAERYGEVARQLTARGIRCLINAGPGEEDLAREAVLVAPQARVISPEIPQLISLLRRTKLCIGGDTGPLHLACTLGVAVVGVYGPTDPARNGPYATRFTVLRHPESERDHSRREQPEAGLLTIPADEVVLAAEALL